MNRVTAEVVTQRKAGKILVHCSSGNRVALWVGAHFKKDHGYSADDARAIAKEMGLTKKELKEKLNAYFN